MPAVISAIICVKVQISTGLGGNGTVNTAYLCSFLFQVVFELISRVQPLSIHAGFKVVKKSGGQVLLIKVDIPYNNYH